MIDTVRYRSFQELYREHLLLTSTDPLVILYKRPSGDGYLLCFHKNNCSSVFPVNLRNVHGVEQSQLRGDYQLIPLYLINLISLDLSDLSWSIWSILRVLLIQLLIPDVVWISLCFIWVCLGNNLIFSLKVGSAKSFDLLSSLSYWRIIIFFATVQKFAITLIDEVT